jgi:hypothetical protein
MKPSASHAHEFAEAREMVLLDWINGTLPADTKLYYADCPIQQITDQMTYARIAALWGAKGTYCTVPAYAANAVMDALRLDGCEDFVVTEFDEYGEHKMTHVWFAGLQRQWESSRITVFSMTVQHGEPAPNKRKTP